MSLSLCSVPPSCQSCVRGWSKQRQTGKSCRRSCARSGRRGKIWSAQSASSSNRWPSLAWWEAAPLLLSPLPPDPLTPIPRPLPPLPLSQRPQRLAKSNCHPSRCLSFLLSLPSFLSQSPANSTDKQIDLKQKRPPDLLRLFLLLFFFFISCSSLILFQCWTDLTSFKTFYVISLLFFLMFSSFKTVFKDFGACIFF